MTVTSLQPTWPLPGSGRRAPWVFGREVIGLAGSDSGGSTSLEWLLKRNCSISPRQLGSVYLSLCCVSLVIALFFLWQGAPFVMAFAGLELLLVGIALLVFARHVGDRELLRLAGRSLSVEQRFGSRVLHTAFTAEWLTVEPAAGQGSLVQLSGEGRTIRIGRFLRPELRPAFARELRLALRRAPSLAVPVNDSTDSN
jgi:uncharacterized membrane protein